MNRLLVPPVEARAKATKGVVYLYDAIGADGFGGGIGELDVVDALAELKKDGARELELRINSPGGSVFSGLAMYRAISEWDGKKTAIIDGLAASAASFVMLAADRVIAAPEAMVMIHEAHGVVVGNAGDMEATAALLRKANDSIVSIYKSRTRVPEADLRQAMAEERWFTGPEAHAAGFVSELLQDEREPVAASATEAAAAVIATFKNAPVPVRALAKSEVLRRMEMRLLHHRITQAASGKREGGQPPVVKPSPSPNNQETTR